jgi:hypothetical protein
MGPSFEEPPFSDALELRPIAADAALHALPDATSAILDSLEFTDVLQVTNAVADDASPQWCNGSQLCSITRDIGDPEWWIHVELPAGGDGWVRSTEVEWASAAD